MLKHFATFEQTIGQITTVTRRFFLLEVFISKNSHSHSQVHESYRNYHTCAKDRNVFGHYCQNPWTETRIMLQFKLQNTGFKFAMSFFKLVGGENFIITSDTSLIHYGSNNIATWFVFVIPVWFSSAYICLMHAVHGNLHICAVMPINWW